MGRVYKARDMRLQRLVALKFLAGHLLDSGGAHDRFVREAHTLSALNHPNIGVIYDIDEFESEPFLALEYLGGGTLAERMQDRPMPLDELLRYAKSLAAGLEHAHRHGIIHRDIKPANALFSSEGTLKLVDFGLAKWRGGATLSDADRTCGTIAYMAPEQARGETVDAHADIYSFGTLLYQMAAGHLPFDSVSPTALLAQIQTEEPKPLAGTRPDLPEPFHALVASTLSKRPADRVPSMSAVLERLEALGSEGVPPGIHGESRESSSDQASTMTAFPTLRSRAGKWRHWVVTGATLAALALAVALVRIWVAPPAMRSVALLPFTAESQGVESADFTAGLQHHLIAQLMHSDDFRKRFYLRPIEDVRSYKVATVKDARGVLKADLVLSGSVMLHPDTYEVILRLTDAAASRLLETQTIQVSRAQSLELDGYMQQAALRMLSPEVKATLAGQGKAGAARNPQAYALCISAEGALRRLEDPGGVDRAISLLNEAERIEGPTALNQALQGEAHLRKFNAGKAADELQQARQFAAKAADLDPSLGTVRLQQARILMATGHPEEAVEKLQALTAAEPRNREAWRQLGRALRLAKRTQEAEAAIRQGASLDPGYWASHSDLGEFYTAEGRFSDAEKEMRIAIDLAPDVFYVYRNLGGLYIHMGKFSQATEQLERALQHGQDAGTYINLGSLNFYQGRYDRAAASYERAVGLAPNDLQAWGSLADAYDAVPGKKQQGREAYQRALELVRADLQRMPKSTGYLSRAALYQAKLGLRAEASATIQRARDAQPQSVDAIWYLARAAEVSGDRAAALELARQALAKGKTSEDLAREPDLSRLTSDPGWRGSAGDRPAAAPR
jgi:tetratricopeptide (TPR) repeat protein